MSEIPLHEADESHESHETHETHESHESHESHETHESHATRQPREGRSRSYSFYTVCIAGSRFKISKFTPKYTKSFEHVFIMSKISGP